MLSTYRLSYATFAALLFATSACGSSSIGSDGGETDDGGSEDEVGTTTDGESESESSTEASSESESDSEASSESESDSESDSEDSAESDSGSTTGELPEPCLGEVGFAMADSPASTVHVFEPGAEPFDLSVPGPLGMGTTVRVAASEDYLIVATSESYWENGEFVQGSVLRLYPRGSDVLIYELEFARVVQRLYVDPDGIVTAALDQSDGVYIEPVDGGAVITLADFAPSGSPASGWIPGHRSNGVGSGFADIDGGWVPVGPSTGWWNYNDGAVEILSPDSDTFVRGTPESVQTFELPDAVNWRVEGSAGKYRLLAGVFVGANTHRLYRLDVDSWELLTIDPELPADLDAFDCYLPSNLVDGQGRVLFELSDAGAARMMSWDPDSDEWAPVGLPATAIEDIEGFTLSANTFAFGTMGLGETFCPQVDWVDPPAQAVAGSMTQFVRLDPPLQISFESNIASTLEVDPEERCLAWRTENETHLTDLASEESISVEAEGALVWLP